LGTTWRGRRRVDDLLETTSIYRSASDGGGDGRLHGNERGRHVAQRPSALPSPALERALAARANRTPAVLAQPERDQETFVAIRKPVDQHPTMRLANAALRQAPVRPTIAVVAGGAIGAVTAETDGRGRPRHDGPRAVTTTSSRGKM
jgi:hypothetical protein